MVSAPVLVTVVPSACKILITDSVEEDWRNQVGEMPSSSMHEGIARGLQKLFVKDKVKEVEIINLTCSAKLYVDKDDPLYRCNFTANPKDASGKLSVIEGAVTIINSH